MHYTAAGSALYPQNSYWEVVTDTIVGVPNPSNIPTFDRLFRARELNGANALESDVLSGRKYYDNRGVLKTGTIPVYDRYKYSFTADNSFPKQIEGAGYYAGITVGVDTKSINPEYIKKGATLFGVTGTYQPNLISKIAHVNKTYDPADDGCEGYSEFTVDVPEPLLKPLVIENLGSQSIASKNNVYTPESPYVGFDKVTVNLQPKLYNTTVTTNGEVSIPEGYDGLGKITVDVGPNLDTSYKVTWNDVKTGATINPSGYSGFNAIRFNTMKFEDYQILYEDLFKETIEPTGDCKAFTKIIRHEDAKPTTLILTAADLINNNNNIINGFTQREVWNQVEIDDIIETNNSFILTSSEQEFFSSDNKLFSSIKVHADLGSYEINKNNISSDPYDIIAGSEQAPMVLGFSNIKLNVRKEMYNLTEAEILNGSPIYSGEGVL
jgi:hypothetical protein